MNEKQELLKQIRQYLKSYEQMTGEYYGDDEQLDGIAYNLLNNIASFLNKK